MAAVALFEVEQVEGIRKVLREAPEPGARKMTRPQAIRSLAADITRLQSKGYSVVQIAGMLTEQGIAVSSSVLKTYLRDARRRAKSRGEGARGRSAGRPSRTGIAPGGGPALDPAESGADAPAPPAADSERAAIGEAEGAARRTSEGDRAGDRAGGSAAGRRGDRAGRLAGGASGDNVLRPERASPRDPERPAGGSVPDLPKTNRTDDAASPQKVEVAAGDAVVRAKGGPPRPSWSFTPREDSDDL